MIVNRGDICWVKMREGNGHEQCGRRPAIIVQNDVWNKYSGTTIIVPLTTKVKKHLPTHVRFLGRDGLSGSQTVLCEQVLTVSKERIDYVIGKVDESVMKNIDAALMISLGLTGGKK